MIIIKSSNNPIVDVLRPAQKLQVWNTYIPANSNFLAGFESRFQFHDKNDFPVPDPMTQKTKTYPSKHAKNNAGTLFYTIICHSFR